MKRKSFIQSSFGAFTASYLPALPKFQAIEDEALFVSPAFLKAGDIIGITAPAGYITSEEIRSAVQKMESWGYKIQIGETIDKRDFTFGGTDEERTKDFQQMLDDPKIKAIMCARGGYGVVRIIDKLNWEKFKAKPKWIIGFSDVTVFHSHLNKNFGIASIHSKMCNSFPDDFSKADQTQIDSIDSIRQCLVGEKMIYKRLPVVQNRCGEGIGPLVGGNLSIIEQVTGSISNLHTEGKILFIEDVGEYLYKIDGMLWNLKRSKKLDRLKGLIVGEFRIKPDDPGEEFGKTIYQMVMEKVEKYHYPVCFDFPVGHQRANFALKCGVQHWLDVRPTGTRLEEI